MKKRIKFAFVLGIIAGLVMILTGILTALKITPPIVAVGLEVGLGIWRIIAGLIILGGAHMGNKAPSGNIVVLILGIFEVFVFIVEKDYSLLTIGPFLAITAGILGLIKK